MDKIEAKVLGHAPAPAEPVQKIQALVDQYNSFNYNTHSLQIELALHEIRNQIERIMQQHFLVLKMPLLFYLKTYTC